MARYTITITAEQPGEPSAKVAVDYTERRGARVLEWSVVAGRNGYAAPPVLDAIITAINGDGTRRAGRAAPASPADLGLSSGTVSALWKAGITRVPQLTAMTNAELHRVSGLRRSHADEIVAALARFDLGFVDSASRGGDTNDVEVEPTAQKTAELPTGAQQVPHQRDRKTGKHKQARRPYRLAPNNLVDLYKQFAGSPSAIAEAQGVPRQTVNNWLRTARNNGRLPLLTPRPDGA